MSNPNTPYRHPLPENQLWNLHHAMDYNVQGQPILRVGNSVTPSIAVTAADKNDALGSIDWEELF
jgi:hypothetical protein